MKSLALAGAFACALALGACGTLANGDSSFGGVDTGIKATSVAVAQADVQAAVNALPQLCNDFAIAAALTNAEVAVLSTSFKIPAKTVANISNASAKGQLLCNGTAAVVAPLAAAAQ